MNYALLYDPAECARALGKLGSQARQDRAREVVRATARQMCVDMGRPVPEALR